jgi:AAA+ ATPase superfamily predicted ATPase
LTVIYGHDYYSLRYHNFLTKPPDLFDRDRQWADLAQFVTSPHPGASLGLVYGRRRQGKTFLLEALTETTRGFYFAALRQSAAQNLVRVADAYRQHVRSRAPISFTSWEDALTALLALGENSAEPVVVVVDEFPYLLETSPEIPSILQDLLKPRGEAARSWRTRLILCGSALSTMRSLLSGTAPLRGRASLELTIHPFTYRDAATFWGLAGDPDTAFRLHALLGGTPAYKLMSGGQPPLPGEPLDSWVAQHLLSQSSAMFREGNVLLAEDDRISDAAPYLAVLAAISGGATRRSQIAAAIGRPATAIAHLLTALVEAQLIRVVDDALRQKRATYVIDEPVLRLHELVIAPNDARLARHQGPRVWQQAEATVSSRIYGPHFEDLGRTWCAEHASGTTLGGAPDKVGPTEVSCKEHGSNHEIDVVVQTRTKTGLAASALGEAKWRTSAVDTDVLRRLEHKRALLGASAARLLLFSRNGFTVQLQAEAAARDDVELVDLDRLYHGH